MISSLKYRIALVIFVLEIIMVSIVLWQTQTSSYKAVKAQIKAQHEIVVLLLEDVSRFALINDDYGDLQIYFKSLKDDPYIIEIAVLNHKKTIVISSNPLHIGIPESELALAKNQHSHGIKLENSAGLIGYLTIIFSNEPLSKVYASTLKTGIIIALISMAMIAFVGIIFGHFLTRRLEQLTRAVKQFEFGELTQELSISGSDEISKLGIHFNEMIMHRQHNENLLRESESLKNTIIESSPDCIKLLDLEGNLIYMSKGGQDKLEIKDITIYLNKYWIDFWQDKDNINARKAVDTAVNGSIGTFQGYSPTETGKPRWWDVIVTPILGSNGQVAKLLAVSRDITEQRQMEDNLRQAQKMESIGTLTGGIAHDFNNIMGIILGNTELALDDIPKSNPGHSSLEEIRKASLRAANIVRQLLSFTRITDQKMQPIEIGLVVKESIKFLRSSIPTTIDIVQDIFVTDETIFADPTQINQIMINLCINASHAMEQTGGTLAIRVENVALDDPSVKGFLNLKKGKHVKIMVSDTGPGIDPKIMDRIFDPYFTTKDVGKGSGMGLAVVHGIVKNHGGEITVDSSPGKGTSFTMLFPLAQGKAEVEPQTIQEIPRGSETILFVDDEISIVNMVQKMFERLGYKVETATTPQDALERFALNPDHFDLVITDMTMPQMTGVSLSEKLMDIRPDIPIIICTGHSALVDEEKAKELGLAAYVMKPINMPEIAKTIRKVLDRT